MDGAMTRVEQKLDYLIKMMERLQGEVNEIKHTTAQLAYTMQQSGIPSAPEISASSAPALPGEGLALQAPPSYNSLQRQASPRPAVKIPVKARSDMTKEEFKDIKSRIKFSAFLTNEKTRENILPPLMSFTPVIIAGYNTVPHPSDFLDSVRGVFTAPMQGRYKFAFYVQQAGIGGLLSMTLVCGDKRKTHKGNFRPCFPFGDSDLVDLMPGEEVWLEVERLHGDTRIVECRFIAELAK